MKLATRTNARKINPRITAATEHPDFDFPVSGWFWSKVEAITTPLAFLCAMSLTFENANHNAGAPMPAPRESWTT